MSDETTRHLPTDLGQQVAERCGQAGVPAVAINAPFLRLKEDPKHAIRQSNMYPSDHARVVHSGHEDPACVHSGQDEPTWVRVTAASTSPQRKCSMTMERRSSRTARPAHGRRTTIGRCWGRRRASLSEAEALRWSWRPSTGDDQAQVCSRAGVSGMIRADSHFPSFSQ